MGPLIIQFDDKSEKYRTNYALVDINGHILLESNDLKLLTLHAHWLFAESAEEIELYQKIKTFNEPLFCETLNSKRHESKG